MFKFWEIIFLLYLNQVQLQSIREKNGIFKFKSIKKIEHPNLVSCVTFYYRLIWEIEELYNKTPNIIKN